MESQISPSVDIRGNRVPMIPTQEQMPLFVSTSIGCPHNSGYIAHTAFVLMESMQKPR